MRKIIIGFVAAFSLIGCQDKVQTVDYYLQHKNEIEPVLQKCYNMSPDAVSKDANCSNASKAKQQIEARRIAAKADISAIMMALKLYKLDNMHYPTSQQGLQALVQRPSIAPIPKDYKSGGYLNELPKDPWGKNYQYQNPGKHGDVDVYTFDLDAPNAQGSDDQSIIGSW
jgi:general secretion pathway protein G